jgi:4-amino-4-deoxy-L-arabinose transferase-like glycosyltransferase
VKRFVINKGPLLLLIVTIAIVTYLQFYRLGYLPIIQWDESRLANNAVEMYLNKSYLVTTYDQKPDMWNTKPPLMIWLQVASISVWGMNEFAIRFPSALAGLIGIFIIGFWVFKLSKSLTWSSVSMLLLATTGGYIQLHGSITGDYDALLTCMVLLSVYFYCQYYFMNQQKAYYGFIVFLVLSVMTKSAAGIMVFPLFVLMPLAKRQFNILFKLLLAMLIALIPFLVFCMFREMASSGFVKQMLFNDFGGRYTTAMEGHRHEWYYYIQNLITDRYHYFVFLLIPAIIYLVFKPQSKMLFLLGFLSGFLLIISLSTTKIHWYDMPILPIVTLLIVLFLIQIQSLIKQTFVQKSFVVMVLLATIPLVRDKYEFIANYKNFPLSFDHYELSEYLRDYKGEESLHYFSLDYDPEYFFYAQTMSTIKKGELKGFDLGDKVVFKQNIEKEFEQLYNFEILEVYKGVKCVRVLSLK